ncbi:MAG: hypothetical protein IJS54_07275 [Desulfovibrio sp.]|nr:hypothetical protein [Desulfovibrio sp.]
MKPYQKILCFFVLLVILCGLGASQFWIKPAVEQELTRQITDYLTFQGFTKEGDISLRVNPFTRSLTIDPMTLQGTTTMGSITATIDTTEMLLTWQGLFAFSPLSSLIDDASQVVLIDRSHTKSMTFTGNGGEVHCTDFRTFGVGTSKHDLLRMHAKDHRPALFFQTLSFGSLTLKDSPNAKPLVSTGAMTLRDITKDAVASASLERVKIKDNTGEDVHIGRVTQENIRILSESEVLALAQHLTQSKADAQAKALLDLFIGDKPLVETTQFDDITITVEKNPLSIGQIRFITAKNAKEVRFSLSRLQILTKLIEDKSQQGLPLPALLSLNLSLSATKNASQTYSFAGAMGIEELFALDMSLDTNIRTLATLFESLITASYSDFSLRFVDKSLLARVSLVLKPDGTGKDYLKKQIEDANHGKNAIDPMVLQEIKNYIDKPGTLRFTSKPHEKFTVAQLAALSEEEVLKKIDLTIQPGSEDIDTQIERIRKER